MKIGKRSIWLCILVVSLVMLVGCGKNEEMKTETLGYQAHTLGTIEKLDRVLGVTQYDNKIYIFGETDNAGQSKTIRQYTSTDGKTWETKDIAMTFPDAGANINLCCVVLDEQGYMLVGYDTVDEIGAVVSCNLWKEENGESVSLDVTELISMAYNNGKTYIYDGKEIEVYGKDLLYTLNVSNMLDFCVNEKEVAVLDDNGIRIFDADNGEKVGADMTFSKLHGEDIQNTKERLGADILSCRRVMEYADDTMLCIALENGLYLYDTSSQQTTCLTDNTDNAYKAKSDILYGYIVRGDHEKPEIIALCSVGDEKQVVAYSDKREDGKTDAQQQKQITVYSLYYAECIEMMIDVFQNNNKDITVHYTWGITDESGISVADAVSALNTQLLAGQGPDVIVMDGLNIRDYEASGVLLELSGVKNRIQEDEPDCLQNVLEAYQTEEGVYALPSKVQFTTLIGPASEIEGIKDVDDLVAYIQNQPKPNYGNDLNLYEWEAFFDVLYPLYASEIIDAEGNYNADKLKEFLNAFKELYNVEMERTTQEEITNWINENGSYVQGKDINSLCMTPLYNRAYSGQKIAFFNMDNVVQAWKFYSIRHDALVGDNGEKSANQDYMYRIWENEEGNLYIPTLIFSINVNSKETDAAEQYVRYMFTTDIQKQYYGDSVHVRQGNSVNLNAVSIRNEEMLQMGTPGGVEEVGGNQYVLSAYFTTDEDANEYIAALKSLTSPIHMDAKVEEIIKEQMPDYVDGKCTMEDTYQAIHNLLGVYLSE